MSLEAALARNRAAFAGAAMQQAQPVRPPRENSLPPAQSLALSPPAAMGSLPEAGLPGFHFAPVHAPAATAAEPLLPRLDWELRHSLRSQPGLTPQEEPA